jgi:hypothetical protein
VLRLLAATALAVAAAAASAQGADFGRPGAPPPANLDEIAGRLRREPYDLELLISFGTSKGGSAGHLAADLDVKHVSLLLGLRVVAAANANIPTEMALKLMREWHASGYAMEVVRYQKIAGSTYVDPRDDEGVAFKDLPDRRPSVLSRDFRREPGEYEDFDNLYALYLLQNPGRSSVRANDPTRQLEIDGDKAPMPYPQAAALAAQSARAHTRGDLGRQPVGSREKAVGETADRPPPTSVSKDTDARQ